MHVKFPDGSTSTDHNCVSQFVEKFQNAPNQTIAYMYTDREHPNRIFWVIYGPYG